MKVNVGSRQYNRRKDIRTEIPQQPPDIVPSATFSFGQRLGFEASSTRLSTHQAGDI